MKVSLNDIVKNLPPKEIIGDINRIITTVVSAKAGETNSNSLLWISDKNLSLLASVSSGCVICSAKAKEMKLNSSCTYLIVQQPRLYFLNVVKSFFYTVDEPFISDHARIHHGARIGRNVTIHPGVVIEDGCVVGDETIVDCNTVIKKNTIIGSRVKIGANNSIGGNGFGYEKNESGQYEFIPHIGNVVIEDDVEIGNNTTIDRAVLGHTLIRKNAKIDNLVHIAHGVDIGENALIIANSMIAGSVIIGANTWVAPSASVLNQLTVGSDAVIGMGAVVIRNVEPRQTIVGNPGKDLKSLKKV